METSMHYMGGRTGLVAEVVRNCSGCGINFTAMKPRPGFKKYGKAFCDRYGDAYLKRWAGWVDGLGQSGAENALMAEFARKGIGALVRIGRGSQYKYSIVIECEDRIQSLPYEIARCVAALQSAERNLAVDPQCGKLKIMQERALSDLTDTILQYLPGQIGTEYGA